MIAASAATELRTEISALNLIELLDLFPRRIAYGARDVDFEVQNAHYLFCHGDTEAERDQFYKSSIGQARRDSSREMLRYRTNPQAF